MISEIEIISEKDEIISVNLISALFWVLLVKSVKILFLPLPLSFSINVISKVSTFFLKLRDFCVNFIDDVLVRNHIEFIKYLSFEFIFILYVINIMVPNTVVRVSANVFIISGILGVIMRGVVSQFIVAPPQIAPKINVM